MTREEAIKILKSKMDGSVDTSYEWAETVRMAIEALQAEAVQGEWIRKEKEINDCDGHRAFYWYECDQCGSRPPRNEYTKQEWLSNFCPNCGARMKVR